MEKQEIKQEKMSADVLIIGGGIAGLTAAISVKEENPDISVLVDEKQTSRDIPEKQIKVAVYYNILIWRKPHRRCLTNIMQMLLAVIWPTRIY